MTLNKFLEAFAFKLVELWPDRHVYANEMPSDIDGNFYIGIIEASHEKRLNRRRFRSIQIEVLYFLASKDNLDYNEWAEDMLDNFEKISVEEDKNTLRTITLTGATVRRDSDARVYQFTCDADFLFLIAPEDLPSMLQLEQNNELKEEE